MGTIAKTMVLHEMVNVNRARRKSSAMHRNPAATLKAVVRLETTDGIIVKVNNQTYDV